MTVFKVPTLALATLLTIALGKGIGIAQTTGANDQPKVQTGLTIHNVSNKKWQSAEAIKVYFSSCAVVPAEKGTTDRG